MDDPRELMSWDDLGLGTRELAQAIYDDGYRPDMVLAIARAQAEVVPAHQLARIVHDATLDEP